MSDPNYMDKVLHWERAYIDANVADLVDTLNRFPSVRTQGSCGGHENPDTTQQPADEWFVSFALRRDGAGCRALAFLVWVLGEWRIEQWPGTATLEPVLGTCYQVQITLPDGLTVETYRPTESYDNPLAYSNRQQLIWFLSGKGSDPEHFAAWLAEMKQQYYDH